MIILDAREMTKRKTAHAYLKQMLSFPDYYGMNLDALHDCLTDLNGVEVQFIHTEDAEPYFEKVLRVFRDAAEDNDGLTIIE